MIKLNFILKIACVLFVLALLAITPLVVSNEVYFNAGFKIDVELASKFGDFFGGFVGTLFSLLSVLVLIYAVTTRYIELKNAYQ